ncbi:MAG: hypothetical protein FWE25_03295 [Lachnospiraceae bacterium]|nr:hypothetical protein [Lachnospiraceae bacterium]
MADREKTKVDTVAKKVDVNQFLKNKLTALNAMQDGKARYEIDRLYRNVRGVK